MAEAHWYFFAVIIFILILNFSIQKKQRRYRNLPPSPPSLPLIGHLHLIKEPFYRTLQSLSHKYGAILLLRFGARSVLLLTSPSAIEECFTKNDVTFSNRPLLIAGKHFNYNYRTVAVAPYGDLWRRLRRIMTLEVLSPARIASSSGVRQEEVRLLVSQLVRSYDRGARKVDLKSKFMELSFNVITMIIAGKRYYGDDVEDAEEATQFRVVIRETVDLCGLSNAADFLPFLRWVDFQGYEKKMVSLMGKTDKFLQKLVDEHGRTLPTVGSDKKTVIHNLLMLRESDPDFYTDEIIKGTIMVIL